jgi:hypothetical protein
VSQIARAATQDHVIGADMMAVTKLLSIEDGGTIKQKIWDERSIDHSLLTVAVTKFVAAS